MTIRDLIRISEADSPTPEELSALSEFLKRLYDTEHADDVDTYKRILSSWIQWRRTGLASSLSKFNRLADGALNSEKPKSSSGLGEFAVSVFLALEQPVSLDTDVETFLLLHKSAVARSKQIEKLNSKP